MRIEGTVAIVTGGSRGIGAATARELSRRGASVGLISRNSEDLEAVRSTLGSASSAVPADITDPDATREAVRRLTDDLGPPDILVNNAGAGAYASMLEEAPETYGRLMALNYLGTVHATLAVLPAMARRERGHIVNVASVAGKLGAPFEAAYSASKFAVVGMTESLAAEMAPYGVGVSLVNPGPVATSFTDARGVPFQRRFPRPRRPEQIAHAVVRAIESGRFEQVRPRWLQLGIVTRALAPGLYHRGLLRDAAREASLARQRFRENER